MKKLYVLLLLFPLVWFMSQDSGDSKPDLDQIIYGVSHIDNAVLAIQLAVLPAQSAEMVFEPYRFERIQAVTPKRVDCREGVRARDGPSPRNIKS